MGKKGPERYLAAKSLIPGGTQLLTKRPERHLPEAWPSYYTRAQGVRVWDLDDDPYIDMSYMGVGANVLGYCDPAVDAAVRDAVDRGNMTTLNCPEEVELAETLIRLHPWADMVRYARTGGEAMAVAVRIARAASGSDTIAFCGYHGWHDWYIAANLGDDSALDGHLLPGLPPNGVPRALVGTARPFQYNDVEDLSRLVSDADLGAIVMEPVRNHDPEPGFLEAVRDLADDAQVPLIFDEVSAGFRVETGGAHKRYGVSPDIAVFAKALGNGYPIAAVIGNATTMEHARDCFISSTYWTERIGPAAALSTIHRFENDGVAEHLQRVGQKVKDGWRKEARGTGLDIEVGGISPLAHFQIRAEQAEAAHTLFTQLMLERGYLATTAFYASAAHSEEMVEAYVDDVGEVFGTLASIGNGGFVEALKSPVRESGFARLV